MTRSQIALVGLRGTGKSTVGQLVAAELGWPFADTDPVLEAAAGQTIATLFATEGEAAFRDRETGILRQVLQTEPVVLATGGGVVLRPENRAALQTAGMVVWLQATPRELAARLEADPTTADRRPALTNLPPLEELEALLAARARWYAAVATLALPTAGLSPAIVAARIVNRWYEGNPASV